MADLNKKKTADKKAAAGADKAEAAAPVKRTSPVQFFQEVRREVGKVSWPSFRETRYSTFLVFVMVTVTMLFFFAVDWMLSLGEKLLIGAAG